MNSPRLTLYIHFRSLDVAHQKVLWIVDKEDIDVFCVKSFQRSSKLVPKEHSFKSGEGSTRAKVKFGFFIPSVVVEAIMSTREKFIQFFFFFV